MEAVIAAGMQAVETLLAHEAYTWGYSWRHDIHRGAYPPKTSATSKLSTTMNLQTVPLNIREAALFYT